MYPFLKNTQYSWPQRIGLLFNYWLDSDLRRLQKQLLQPPTAEPRNLVAAALGQLSAFTPFQYRGELSIPFSELTSEALECAIQQKVFIGRFAYYAREGRYEATWLGILYAAAVLQDLGTRRDEDFIVERYYIYGDNVRVYAIDIMRRLLEIFTARELVELEIAMTGKVDFSRSFGLPLPTKSRQRRVAAYAEKVVGVTANYASPEKKLQLFRYVLENIRHNGFFNPVYLPQPCATNS